MARKITLSSMMIALCIIFLYLAGVVPSSKLFLLCFCSIFIAIIMQECGIKYAVSAFLASSLLGFLLMPNKFIMLPFIAFLGYYPIAKLYLERQNKALEYVIKLLIFNVALIISYFIAKAFIVDIKTWLLVIFFVLAQGIFLVYDYVLSMSMTLFNKYKRP